MARNNLDDYSLDKLGFQSFSDDEKRVVFVILDAVMKHYHEKNKAVTSFNPKDIYYIKESQIFDFGKVDDMTSLLADSKEQEIMDNVTDAADLAFCTYLKGYDPKDGLLHKDVIASEFSKFKGNFNPDDVDYYEDILVNSRTTHTPPKVLYYSDYISKKEQEKKNAGQNSNQTLVKATMAGRMMADDNREAAFGTTFFMVCMTSSMVMATVGLILYIVNALF